MKFVIEHLEPKLFEWCLIEYRHISEIVGAKNAFFTNARKKDFSKLKNIGKTYEKGISELCSQKVFGKACVLSQHAKKTLSSEDNNKFQCLVFGGILGDDPAKKRTAQITNSLKSRKITFGERNLGGKQMPTDVAVFVAKKILEGAKFHEMKFCDNVEIEIDENESIILPFRYAVDGNKITISEKLVDYLRKRKEF